MARRKIVVSSSGGIAAGSPFTLLSVLAVQQVSPPVAFTQRLAFLLDAEESIVAPGVQSGVGSFIMGRAVVDSANGTGQVFIGDTISTTSAAGVHQADHQILVGTEITIDPTATNSSNIAGLGRLIKFNIAAGHNAFGNSVCIGTNVNLNCSTSSDATDSVVIGSDSTGTGGQVVVVGQNANATGTQGIAVGVSSVAGVSSIAIGFNSAAGSTSGNAGVAIGASAKSGTNGIAIGFGATNTGNDSCLAIGNQSTTNTGAARIALGTQAACGRDNQLLTGSPNFPIREICWGDGQALFGTAGGFTYRLTTTTVNGINNAAGMGIQIVPGYGTGNWPNAENLGIDLRVGIVQASGATAQVETSVFGIRQSDLNVSIWGGLGATFGGGVKAVFIGNATTVPTTNPTGGGLLYVDAGALKYRGSGGTVTVLGPA